MADWRVQAYAMLWLCFGSLPVKGVASSTAATIGAYVSVEPVAAIAREGADVVLMCQAVPSNLTVIGCMWRFPDQDWTTVEGPDEWSDNFSLGYRYSGAGPNTGQCGVVLKSVNVSHGGMYECRINRTSDHEDLFSAVNLTVITDTPMGLELFIEPQRPLKQRDMLTATCVARTDLQDVQFSWTLGDQQLQTWVPVSQVVDGETGQMVSFQSVSVTVTPNDDKQYLQCSVNHPSLLDGCETCSLNYEVSVSRGKNEINLLTADRVSTVALSVKLTVSPEGPIRVGQGIYAECIVTGAFPRTMLKWYVDDDPIDTWQGTKRTRTEYASNGTLVVREVVTLMAAMDMDSSDLRCVPLQPVLANFATYKETPVTAATAKLDVTRPLIVNHQQVAEDEDDAAKIVGWSLSLIVVGIVLAVSVRGLQFWVNSRRCTNKPVADAVIPASDQTDEVDGVYKLNSTFPKIHMPVTYELGEEYTETIPARRPIRTSISKDASSLRRGSEASSIAWEFVPEQRRHYHPQVMMI